MGENVTVDPLTQVDNSSFVPSLQGSLNKLADEFDKVLYKQGSEEFSGDINANSKRLYNLPLPTLPHEPVRLGDVGTLAKGDPGSPGRGYPTKVALAATTPTNLDDAYLSQPGSEGIFVFSTADLSASVTADPGQVNYIAPSYDLTGASGAWVRKRDSETDSLINAKVATSSLAAAAGASLVGFQGRGAGTVIQVLQDRLRRQVWVTDYGAVGDGLTNNDAAFSAAITALAATGGEILIPEGVYVVSSLFNITTEGISFKGMGRWRTAIKQNNLTVGVFNSTAMFFKFVGIKLMYGGVANSGVRVINSEGSYGHFEDFHIDGGGSAIHLKTGVGQRISNFELLNYETAGVVIEGLNDVFIDSFLIDAGNTSRGALGGVRLLDKVEALVMSNGDILNGSYSMTMDATVNGQATRPAYNKFANVYFDSAANGVALSKCVEFDFESCWFSNRPSSGCIIGATCDGIRFNGGGAINNGQNGMVVETGAKRVMFGGFSARGNSTVTPNTYSGIYVQPGATDFAITGCTLGGGTPLGFGTQKYGVEVGAGASDRYLIKDNLVSGNGTGGVLDGGTGVNKKVADNY